MWTKPALFIISATLLCAEFSLSTNEPVEWVLDVDFSNLLPQNDSVVEDQQVLTLHQCAGLCSTNQWCSSFTFSPHNCGAEQGVCRCYRFVFTDLANLLQSDGTEYYRISDSNCPYEEQYYRSRQDNLCLRLFQGGNMNNDESEEKCQQHHGRLPILDTRNKTNWAWGLIRFNLVDKSDSCHVYLGAHATQLKMFYWDSTKKRLPDNGIDHFWGWGEPTGRQNELCLVLRPGNTEVPEWDDYRCTYRPRLLLCEYVG